MDKNPLENVLGSCIFRPDNVIFLCDKRESSSFKEQAVTRLLRARKIKTQVRFYYFNATDPAEIRTVLTTMLRDWPGCVFDFTGGRDLVLAVAGAVCADADTPCYYIDIPGNRFINVQHCGQLAQRFAVPPFSVEDIFALTGAAVTGSGHFDADDLQQPAFEEDVLAIWQLVQRNPKAWGNFVAYLQASSSGTPLTALRVSAPENMRSGRSKVRQNPAIFAHLYGLGVFTEYRLEGGQLYYSYKSPLHKKCLLNQGVWLELFCYVTARRSDLFDDVRTSVVVDWAGSTKGPDGTKNEVDAMLVKGVVPVFVSCKMSVPSPLALSEIRLLSAKFGGTFSRTVVLTAAKLTAQHKALRTRAEDLDILLLGREDLEAGTLAQRLLDVTAGSSTLAAP